MGQVWYLIVSIPDLCTLTYFFYISADKKRRQLLLRLVHKGLTFFLLNLDFSYSDQSMSVIIVAINDSFTKLLLGKFFSIKMSRDHARKELLGSCPKYFLKFYFKNGFGHDPESSFLGTIPQHFFNQNISGSCPNRTFGIMPKVIFNFYFKNDFGHDPESSFSGKIPTHFFD